MSMTSIAETLDRIAGDHYQSLTESDRLDVNDILDAAFHFDTGQLPIHEFARLSSGKMRFAALIATPKSDHRRTCLLKAINAVLVYQGLIVTTAGVWTPEDLGIPSSMGPMRVHASPVLDPWQDAASTSEAA